MAFEGFRDAIRAFGSGGAIEQQAFNAEGRRLVSARSATALMDSRVARAIQDSQEADSAVALKESFGDDPTDIQLSVLSKLAAQFLAGERAEGVGQQNIARGMQLENITSGDPIDIDLQNLLTQIAGDKLLGPTNVRVEAQAGADITATGARTRASEAAAAFNESRTAGIDGKNTAFSSLTAPEQALNFGVDTEGQAAYNQFLAWKARKAGEDPNYRNATFALEQYRLEQSLPGIIQPGALSTSGPGSSKENPLITDGTGPRPPAGTWVRTRSGRVVQVPRLDVDNQSDLTEGL